MLFPSLLGHWLTLIGPAFLVAHAATIVPTDTTSNASSLSLLTPNDTNTTITSTSRRILLPFFGRDDHTTIGNYQIVLCNTDQADSKAARLKTLLPLIQDILRIVIRDAETKGTSSRYGFGAFFKTDDSRAAVTDAYQKMVDGDTVDVSADRAIRIGSRTASPTFACMEQGDSFTAHLLAKCSNRAHGKRIARLMTWGASEIIMICPAFWDMPSGLTRSSCPRVVDNRMVPNDETLMRSMFGSIVRILAHIYVPESLDYGNSYVETVDNVQDVIELNETASLVNANNYGFYASGKLWGWSLFPFSFSTNHLHLPTVGSHALVSNPGL